MATIRSVASAANQGGYTKLVQLGFIIVLGGVFLSIVVHYFLYPGSIDRIDLLLTVVVGWMGLIIGRFFGEEVMESLELRKKGTTEHLVSTIAKQSELIQKYKGLLTEKEIKQSRRGA